MTPPLVQSVCRALRGAGAGENAGVLGLQRTQAAIGRPLLIDRRRYEHAARSLDEIGRLIGGWSKAHDVATAS